MRPWLAIVFCALLGCGQACAACVGPPYDQFDFWLGAWHDPAAPASEHYTVRRTAGGCAIEEVLTGGNGQIQGIGVSGWDSERKQWRQLWADKDRIVTVYIGGPAADGTFVLTSEPKGGECGGGTPTGTSGPMALTPNMPRAAAKTDPGSRCGRVTSTGSDRRKNNDCTGPRRSSTAAEGGTERGGGFFGAANIPRSMGRRAGADKRPSRVAPIPRGLRPSSMRQEDHPTARAAAVISESIGNPPHLSLPPFEVRSPFYLTLHHHLLHLRGAVCCQHLVACLAPVAVRLRCTERRTGHVAGRLLCRRRHCRSWGSRSVAEPMRGG
jgi:hypothetical protein